MKDIKKIQEFFSKPLGEGTLTQDELAYYRDNAMEKLANADIVDKKLGKTRQGDKYIMVMYKEKWDFANPPKKGMYNPETQWVKVFYNDESEIQDLMALKETKVVNEGKQLDQVDFAKVVKAVEQTGHPVTVLLVPKFNEIEVITGMDAPDDMLRDLSNAVDALGYSRNDIFIAGDSSNLSRREYSDISRVNGGAKDYFEESVNEMDMNDPVLIKMRAAKDKLAKMRAANAGDDGNDKFFDNAKKIAFLKKERAQLMRDMEQEAEPEGGPIADEYGSKLNRIDAAIAKLSGRKEMDYDTAVGKVNEYDVYMPSQEEVDRFFELTNNETHYLYSKPVMGQEGTFNLMPIEPWDEYDYSNWKALVGKAKAKGKSIDEASRARVSKPRFKKDKNAPNFLNVYIDYDLGPGGATIALGKETMTGQIRRESAAEAMQLAGAVARDLEAKYDLEDIDIQDLKNGKVRIFAVSDDFIDMDPNMLSEASKGAMNYFSDLKYNYQKAFRYLDVEEREEYKQLVKDFFSNLQIDDKVRAVNLEEAVNPEVHRLVNAFVRKMADRYDYPLQDAVYAILEVLRSQNYLGLDEAIEKDPIDTITMDVPLFIRVLEYAREDAQADMDLHDLAEKAIAGTKQQGLLQMDDYDMLVGELKQIGMEENMSLDDEAKAYYLAKVKRGEIDTLPEDPKAAFLAQMTKDQMDHDKETLRRERGLEEGASTEEKKIAKQAVNRIAKYRGVEADEAKADLIRATKELDEITSEVISKIKEDRPGLWANIHAQRKRGEKPARKGSKDYKSAVKAGKEINKQAKKK